MVTCPRCGEENTDRARFCLNCGLRLQEATPGLQARRVVTVLFTDVAGSTSLGEAHDPEAMRLVLDRFFEAATQIIERHGGRVEKVIGDAVLGVFGLPRAHEDDALRAVRSAVELNEALDRISDAVEQTYDVRLRLHTGVDTDEVVVGPDDPFAAGDAMRLATRLEQAAGPGEVVIGDATRWLVRGAVEVEPVVDGADRPAWRVRRITGDAPFVRRLDGPLVGREDEVAALGRAYSRTAAEPRCRLVTVLGAAGIGKSRLVRELTRDVVGEARVLFGRCLPYGDGITYWPLAQIVREAAEIGVELEAEEARSRVAALVGGHESAELVAERLAAAIGLGGTSARPEEIAWAARVFLERLASAQPLVVVVDDVQWGEPTFLDLVEYMADRMEETPVLLVCTSRPELLETRPAWMADRANVVWITLEPLTRTDSDRLIEHLVEEGAVDTSVRDAIAAAADGVPLFVEEMLAMLREDGTNGGVTIPPTIHALLAARLDRLPPPERAVLERAAVVGEEFREDAVADLAGGDVAEPLARLVGKDVVRQAEDGFAFRHVLLRDAAYGGMSKELRAELHERYADFLEGVSGERVAEVEEIVGYHLEQAARYRGELGLDGRGLAVRAAERLGSAGSRAYARADMPAATHLLERAVALVPAGDPARPALQVELGSTLRETGRLPRAEQQLSEAEHAAAERGDRAVELAARVVRTLVRAQTDPDFDILRTLDETGEAIAELEALGDRRALARAWRLAMLCRVMILQFGDLEVASREVLEHSRRAGDAAIATEALYWLAIAIWWGPDPVSEALPRCEALLAETRGPSDEASVLTSLAGLYAMTGDVGRALETIDRARDRFHELGLVLLRENAALGVAQIQLHGGDPLAAERTLRASTTALEQFGETGYLSTQLAFLASVVAIVGSPDEALEIADRSQALTAHGDVLQQAFWNAARARAFSRLGRHEEATPLVEEAVAMVAAASDDPHTLALLKGEAADVLAAAGRIDDARRELEEALALHERKGCVPCIGRTRWQLGELGGA
jgi:class 3 adenylate cyclase/tetratricopeptide (TPR) repeat protein